jgi:hypothetical protein
MITGSRGVETIERSNIMVVGMGLLWSGIKPEQLCFLTAMPKFNLVISVAYNSLWSERHGGSDGEAVFIGVGEKPAFLFIFIGMFAAMPRLQFAVALSH